jgi:hypothetical protein
MEVSRMGKKLSPVFGFDFPKLKFDKRIIPLAKVTARVSNNFINEKRIKELINNIYNKDLPNLVIYINTTPFSSWNLNKKYLSISYGRNNELKFFSTVCHEANHLMYDSTFRTQKYQDTEVKETITILNDFFGAKDLGWNKFSKQRKKALNFYNRTKDFQKTIAYIQKLFRSRRG